MARLFAMICSIAIPVYFVDSLSFNSIGILMNLDILSPGIFIRANCSLSDSLSTIIAARFKLRLLIKGNGCAGSTAKGVRIGKIAVVK
tara:strand:+ start:91 stop:354 length:264 start_codon:yes stop_codon:yes gene_type:complete